VVATIVFDGVCNFCNGWVRFVLERDDESRYRFAAAQSISGTEILNRLQLPTDDLTSIILQDADQYFGKSEAVIRILCGLGGPWRALWLLRAIPVSLRDAAYDFFAKRRYRLFGKAAACPMPDPSWKDKLLQ
jgi:predicted DCC family thiol-disulfide oxidoreductase YuxK